MPDLHPQDWLLVAEALVFYAGDPREFETGREERAYELAELIAAEQGLEPHDLARQIDNEWSGPPS